MKRIEQTEDQTIYIRPIMCIRSLTAFNNSVITLTNTVRLALDHGMVDPKISKDVRDHLNGVTKFYPE